jgi:hypothetical protein
MYRAWRYVAVDNARYSKYRPLPMYKSHRNIIDAWPRGLPGFAEDHGVKYDTAKGWRRRDSIPPERWPETIRLSKIRRVDGVTLETLSDLRHVGKCVRQNDLRLQAAE